jgi:hypothetical protein
MATDKKTMDLNDPKVMRELMVNLRDSIQDYLDNMELDKAEQKAKKEKK